MSSVQHTPVTPPIIRLENISVRRDERDILRNVDFALQAKEIVTLIGPNGAGKSTLIKILQEKSIFRASTYSATSII